MEIKRNNGLGGRRPGAGRPRKPDAKVTLTVKIDTDLFEIVSRQANKSQFVNRCIRQYVSEQTDGNTDDIQEQ